MKNLSVVSSPALLAASIIALLSAAPPLQAQQSRLTEAGDLAEKPEAVSGYRATTLAPVLVTGSFYHCLYEKQ